MDNIVSIYGIKNIITNKIYIGASLQTKRRIATHFVYLRRGIHINKSLQSDFDLYGELNFEHFILEEISTKDLIFIHNREIYYYNLFSDNIYNLQIPKPLSLKIHRKIPNHPKLRKKFIDRVKIIDGCWEWTGSFDKDNYAIVTFRGKNYRASRVSYFVFHCEQPGDKSVCHTCDNPSCINPYHLFLGTNYDNVMDRVRKGRIGLKHINWTVINQIRKEYAETDITPKELGLKYNLKSVHQILKNKVWYDPNYIPTEKPRRPNQKQRKKQERERRARAPRIYTPTSAGKHLGITGMTLVNWAKSDVIDYYFILNNKYKMNINHIINLRSILTYNNYPISYHGSNTKSNYENFQSRMRSYLTKCRGISNETVSYYLNHTYHYNKYKKLINMFDLADKIDIDFSDIFDAAQSGRIPYEVFTVGESFLFSNDNINKIKNYFSVTKTIGDRRTPDGASPNPDPL